MTRVSTVEIAVEDDHGDGNHTAGQTKFSIEVGDSPPEERTTHGHVHGARSPPI